MPKPCHLFITPIVVCGGKPSLPNNVRVNLELLDERRFGNGVVYLRCRLHAAIDTRQLMGAED